VLGLGQIEALADAVELQADPPGDRGAAGDLQLPGDLDVAVTVGEQLGNGVSCYHPIDPVD